MENYFASKMQLFNRLSKTKTAIINIDDPYSDRICSATSARIITYGMDQNADLHPTQSDFSSHGTQAQLHFEQINISIDTTLIGEYNLSNIMAATAVCLNMGISPKRIEQAMRCLPPIPGRLEHIPCHCPGKVFVDYAHTPDAYEKLFSNLKNLAEEEVEIFVVFGCGGDRDTGKRKELAAIVEKYATFSFITMDNPRTESIEKINADIIQGFSRQYYDVILDRKNAIQAALSRMGKKSILLVLGKGRENYQIIGLEKQPHSDIDIIRQYQHAG
jgi:UDP-N-acetylmuramoyl-L-alanyl-D-glutamate--2,6-diaminopimelate ligase